MSGSSSHGTKWRRTGIRIYLRTNLKSGELPAIHTPPGAGLVVEVIIVVDSGTESGMVQEEEEDVEEDAAAAAAALAAVVRRHGC